MTAFEFALSFTLREETGGDPDGGYTDRPTDRGGPTKWGISQRAYPHLKIRDLTREQAIEIYRADYWMRARCPDLSAPVSAAHFDAAVLHGVGAAAEILQRTVGANPDGAIGLATLESLRLFTAGRGPTRVAAALVEQRARYICDLVDQPEKPRERANLKNLEGWVTRLIRLTAYVSRSAP